MNLKRFRYEDGLDIIAPLKHGTRWLEEKTNPISIEEIYSMHNIQGITKKTYWVYREPKEHMLSALRTEIRTGIEFNGDNKDVVIDKFKTNMGLHWSPTLIECLYQYWNEIGLNLIHLKDLSNLFHDVEYLSNNYDMSNFIKAKHTIKDIIELVGTDINDLYKLCDKEELWLKRILNDEKGLVSYNLLIQKQQRIDELNLINQATNDYVSILKNDILNLKLSIKSMKRKLI